MEGVRRPDARKLRIDRVHRRRPRPPRTKPRTKTGDGDFVLFVPEFGRRLLPSSGPTDAERKRTSSSAPAAPGQLVTLRLAVTPFVDLGECKFAMARLSSGPATLPAKAVDELRQELALRRRDAVRDGPAADGRARRCEKGVTREWYFTLAVPADAKPGIYKGTWTFRPEQGQGRRRSPSQLEVLPVHLEERAAAVAGHVLHRRATNRAATTRRKRRLLKEQVQFMRRLGMTGVSVGAPTVTGLARDDKVTLTLRRDDARPREGGRHGPAPEAVPDGQHPRRRPGDRPAAARQPRGEGRSATPASSCGSRSFRDYFLDALKQ